MYPAGVPSRTNKTIAQVINDPRLAGDKKPKHAKASVTIVIQKTCTPDPSSTDNSIPFLGGLNMSP